MIEIVKKKSSFIINQKSIYFLLYKIKWKTIFMNIRPNV